MSVVNKMLKDLEQREGNNVYEADYVPIESNSAKSRRFIVGGTLVIIATAIAVWLLLPNDEKEATILAKAPLANLTILPTNSTVEDEAANTVNMQDFDANTLASLASSTTVSAPVLDENVKIKAEQALDPAPVKKVEIETAAISSNQVRKDDEAQVQVKVAEPTADDSPEDKNKLVSVKSAPVLAQAKEPKEPVGVFSVSSNSKSTSNNRMLEQQIQLSLQNGDTPAAIKDLNELISLEPRNVSARKRLASLLFANGDAVRAAMLLHQGLQLSPEDSSMRLMQARLLFREKKNIQALALLKEHPATVIADDELLSFRAALAEKQSDYQTSHEDYSTLLQRQPNNARWMLGLAISQDKQLMHEQAVSNYRKVKSSNQLSAKVLSFVDGRLAVLAGS